jgi:hypothetical protein
MAVGDMSLDLASDSVRERIVGQRREGLGIRAGAGPVPLGHRRLAEQPLDRPIAIGCHRFILPPATAPAL